MVKEKGKKSSKYDELAELQTVSKDNPLANEKERRNALEQRSDNSLSYDLNLAHATLLLPTKKAVKRWVDSPSGGIFDLQNMDSKGAYLGMLVLGERFGNKQTLRAKGKRPLKTPKALEGAQVILEERALSADEIKTRVEAEKKIRAQYAERLKALKESGNKERAKKLRVERLAALEEERMKGFTVKKGKKSKVEAPNVEKYRHEINIRGSTLKGRFSDAYILTDCDPNKVSVDKIMGKTNAQKTTVVFDLPNGCYKILEPVGASNFNPIYFKIQNGEKTFLKSD